MRLLQDKLIEETRRFTTIRRVGKAMSDEQLSYLKEE